MEIDLNNIDTDCLKKLYETYYSTLQEKLLTGASWKEVDEERKITTQMAIELHRRSPSSGGLFNPAESLERRLNKKPEMHNHNSDSNS